MSFHVAGAWYRYSGQERHALCDVTASFPQGLHTAIVGPNGAGKSTMLRILLGRASPDRGSATFDGRLSARWSRRELARRVGVVLQDAGSLVPLRVRELVEMGRHPYLRPWSSLGSRDRTIVAESLRLADLAGFEDREISHLSGGELQRARLARALAQRPEYLLLDEPTAHLDVRHEMEIFQLVSHLVVQQSVTVITVTHNINLASRFADRLLLLSEGEVVAHGAPGEVFNAENLEAAFGWPIAVRELDGLGLHAVPLDAPARREPS
jgi:iron complex transport system ATP-binding protein